MVYGAAIGHVGRKSKRRDELGRTVPRETRLNVEHRAGYFTSAGAGGA
jgi:hypothetical protein